MTGPDRHRVKRAALVAALVVCAVAAAWLATAPPSDDLPLSPHSTAHNGTRALTDVLDRLGTEVVIEPTPPEEATTGLLLIDNIGDEQRERWRDIARRGGTLVVADPGSELTPELVGETAFGFLDPSIGRDCDLEALAGVSRVQAQGVTFDAPSDGVGCFGRGEGHWLVVEPEGSGALVSVGGSQFLTNEGLSEADNAILAAALLAPREGEVVAIAPPDFAASDADSGLLGLVPGGAWALLAQLLIAFCVVLWWRARRLGAPVVEEQPVALPGSELVMGLGNLYAQTGAAGHAAGLLREEAVRSVATRLRLGPLASAAEATEAAVAAGVDRSLAEDALVAPLPADDRGLVELAGTVERLRAALDSIDDPKTEGVARV